MISILDHLTGPLDYALFAAVAAILLFFLYGVIRIAGLIVWFLFREARRATAGRNTKREKLLGIVVWPGVLAAAVLILGYGMFSAFFSFIPSIVGTITLAVLVFYFGLCLLVGVILGVCKLLGIDLDS